MFLFHVGEDSITDINYSSGFDFQFSLAEVEGAKRSFAMFNNSINSTKLFVFGDSYLDTGNFANSYSFKPPNGITFPGIPAGRFCDGRVLTDFVASFLKIESPTPYRLRNSTNAEYGLNFAYGGTGIFKTVVDGPNTTVQIDSFEDLIRQNFYKKEDLDSSVALVNAGANDYTFALKNGKIIEIEAVTKALVNQMSVNLKRLGSLGIRKIAVGLMQPLGCLPVTLLLPSPLGCNDIINLVSKNHNKLLRQAVQDLNNQAGGKPLFIALDLYESFDSSIKTMQKNFEGNSTLMNPLVPCCHVNGVGNSCGSVDDKGEKKYTLCEKPELSFFWDEVHPSQNGWSAVFNILQPSLSQLT
ncbi:hypothetical protein RJT34_24607 [Clitoria ternatea]|uniref:Uncharacterized protein n=1 Tax=Clitoria ternatea TaxID=43366 RepID=A0AAN9FNC8_CLITE